MSILYSYILIWIYNENWKFLCASHCFLRAIFFINLLKGRHLKIDTFYKILWFSFCKILCIWKIKVVLGHILIFLSCCIIGSLKFKLIKMNLASSCCIVLFQFGKLFLNRNMPIHEFWWITIIFCLVLNSSL